MQRKHLKGLGKKATKMAVGACFLFFVHQCEVEDTPRKGTSK